MDVCYISLGFFSMTRFFFALFHLIIAQFDSAVG